MQIFYKPEFVKRLNKLEIDLKEEVIEKIELFKSIKNHQQLKVHKLKGVLLGRYSFSVNFKYRIVFIYGKNKNEIIFLTIGDHSIYK